MRYHDAGIWLTDDDPTRRTQKLRRKTEQDHLKNEQARFSLKHTIFSGNHKSRHFQTKRTPYDVKIIKRNTKPLSVLLGLYEIFKDLLKNIFSLASNISYTGLDLPTAHRAVATIAHATSMLTFPSRSVVAGLALTRRQAILY